MDKIQVTRDEEDSILVNLGSKSRVLILPKDENLLITLGMGFFEFNPPYFSPDHRPPAYFRDYGAGHPDTPSEFRAIEVIAQSELARLRSAPGIRHIAYNSNTWLGPPTKVGEVDDIQLMGYLILKFPDKYVFAGDFIRGFNDEGECLYQKVIEFHSLQRDYLQAILKEGLSSRLINYDLSLIQDRF